MIFHDYKAKSHTFLRKRQNLLKLSWRALFYPVYSPDVAHRWPFWVSFIPEIWKLLKWIILYLWGKYQTSFRSLFFSTKANNFNDSRIPRLFEQKVIEENGNYIELLADYSGISRYSNSPAFLLKGWQGKVPSILESMTFINDSEFYSKNIEFGVNL